MKHADPAFIYGKDIRNIRVLSKGDVSEFLGGEEFIDEWIQTHNFEYGFECIQKAKVKDHRHVYEIARELRYREDKQQYLIVEFG